MTYEDVALSLSEIKKKQLPFDVFQVDEGWEITLGEWEPNEKFPRSMKEVAQEIRNAGLTAGIWTSPFIAHETASVWKKHPKWILPELPFYMKMQISLIKQLHWYRHISGRQRLYAKGWAMILIF